MVVFTCNTCGESLKKNQVEKHYLTKCRNCEVLSCVDCGKDFWGDDYQQHTKCISEEEKYSGKNYVPKPNANKGEVKQGQWLQQVQEAIEQCKTNARLKHVLERMKEYPNIPRKKAKFENFLGNSLNVRDKALASQVWELLMVNTQQSIMKAEQQTVGGKQELYDADNSQSTAQEDHKEITPEEETKQKLSKRERKEQRRKEKHKLEKKDKNSQENVECETQENGIQTGMSKKKRKLEEREDELVTNTGPHDSSSETEVEPRAKKNRIKFDWEAVIIAVVSKKGLELSLKKVRKKVIAEYLAQGGSDKSEEKLWARLEKKIKKNPKFHLHKDRVKIVTSR